MPVATAGILTDRVVVEIFFGPASGELLSELERIVHIVRAIDVSAEEFDPRTTANRIAAALAERDPQRCCSLLAQYPAAQETLTLARLPGMDQVGPCYLYQHIWQLAFDVLQARAWGPRL
jgi:hypothetical protein